MFKKLFAALASLVLIATTASSAQAYEPWATPGMVKGEMRLSISEGALFGTSILKALKVSPSGTPLDENLCPSIGTGICKAGTGWIVRGDLLLGVCVDKEVNCIESVSIYKKGETPTPATLVGNIPGVTTPANIAADVPRGSTVSVWQSTLPNSSGATTYATSATVSFHVFGPKAGFEAFTASVIPVKEVADPEAKDIIVEQREVGGKTKIGTVDKLERCEYQYAGQCATRQNFAANTRVSMTLRMTSALTGWLKGRIQDPNISISSFAKGYNRINVDASPVDLPMLSASFTNETFPTPMKSSAQFAPAWQQLQEMSSTYGAARGWYADSANGLSLVEATRSALKDTASGLQSTWSFASIFRPDNTANKCLKDKTKVLGLVTTNSMAYEGGPPVFKGGFLQYQVAGMHYLPDGKTLARGTYDLVMRSSVARCLYNFTKAPVSATFSITGGSNKEVATTVVGENGGWLKLAAYNFTYSKKTIKIKITQKK